MLGMQAPPAALRRWRWCRGPGSPLGQFLPGHQQVHPSPVRVQFDQVALFDECQRTAARCLRRAVQHHGAAGGATHARVRYPYHVAHPGGRQLAGNGQRAGLRHAGGRRTAVAQHQHVVRRDRQRRVVDACRQIGGRLEHQRRPAVAQQGRGGGRALEDRPVGCQRAAQYGERPRWTDRLTERTDYRSRSARRAGVGPLPLRGGRGRAAAGWGTGVPGGARGANRCNAARCRLDCVRVRAATYGELLAQRQAAHTRGVEPQQRAQLGEHRGHAAGTMQVLQPQVAAGLAVDQQRYPPRGRLEGGQGKRNAGTAGNCEQMDDGVGGAADRQQGGDGIGERCRRKQVSGAHRGLRQGGGAAARGRGVPQARPGTGRRGGTARQHHAQRFGQAGHGGSGPHHHARATGGAQFLLHVAERRVIQLTGAVPLPVGAAVGAGAEPGAAPGTGAHWAGHHRHRRHVRRCRGHQLRRYGLVAAAEQHRRIHRVGGERLLGLHRQQVAVQHRSGRDQDLAQREGRQGERQRAPLQHAAPRRSHQRRHVAVAGGVVGGGIDDCYHGTRQIGFVVAGGGQECTAQK